MDRALPCRVERVVEHGPGAEPSEGLHIRFEVAAPRCLRLDRLLASELGVSRSTLGRLVTSGCLQVLPQDKRALRRTVRDGQEVFYAP